MKFQSWKNIAGRSIACLCMFVVSAGLADVGGFLDAQLTTVAADDTNSPTFGIYDGAVYLSKTMGKGTGMVDIPFSFAPMTMGTTPVAAGSNNSFGIALNKAQAYLSYHYDFDLKWTLGQFDSIYGFEAKDSINVALAAQGLLFSAVPITHTGLLLTYANGPIEIKAVASNPLTQGLRNGNNFQFGGVVRFSQKMFYFSAGYLHHKDKGPALNSMLVDMMAGVKMDALTVDIECILGKPATATAETGFGIMGHGAYQISERLAMALRVEYLKKLTFMTGATATLSDSNLQTSIGPQFHMTDDLRVKLGYTLWNFKATSVATATTYHVGTLAGLYRF